MIFNKPCDLNDLYPFRTTLYSSMCVIMFLQVMRAHLKKTITIFIFAIAFAMIVPLSPALAVTTTTSGYGGGCTIPVTPPSDGFKLAASPIYREWWDWWSSPKVWLAIDGGNAAYMKISNYSDFHDGYYGGYQTGMKWRVSHADREGWKKVYAKFLSSCGLESPVISTSYYYWGW